MIYYFLDTSAILNGALKKYPNALISTLVISELENIKTSAAKDEHIKYQAREAVRAIIERENTYVFPPTKTIDKLLKKYQFLSNINDHKILCEAKYFADKNKIEVHFVTNDGALYLFAKKIKGIVPIFYGKEEKIDDVEWCGWNTYSPNSNDFAALYSNPNENILGCKTNEYAKIVQNNKLEDVLVWTGEQYRPLKYKEITTNYGERIKPRNIEQKMYLDLLQNKDVPVKLCIGRFGSGKSLLALCYAIHEVQMGAYDKIVFVKNNLDVKGAGKLGTLPGDEIAKQMPWLRQLEDHLGTDAFEDMLNSGRIEPAHLSTLRGRDFKNSILIADEAENFLTTNIQLLLGRIGENSEIIFCADVKQCDYKDQSMSGIPKLIENLKGHKLFGMVKLIKAERSATAALADLLDR